MDLLELRTRTAAEHEAVEGSLPLMTPDLDRSVYVRTLRLLYGILRAWEDWAAEHAPESLSAEVASRRRSNLLEQDLRFFGEPIPSASRPVLELAGDESEFLGAMYVIEGSTLGGQHIARHVAEQLQLQPGEGNAYFRGYAEDTSVRWRAFQDILRAVPEHHTNAVIRGARSMFLAFRMWMLQTNPEQSNPVQKTQ